jgi:hypothetical protein
MPRPRLPYRQAAPGTNIGDIGKGVTDLMGAIQKSQAAAKLQQQQQLQNQVANQMMNTQVPPRAALVAPGVNPQTGAANVVKPTVSTAGTAPFTGGMDQLQAQVNAQKLINQLYPNAAIGQARAAAALGARGPVGPAGGSRSGWARQAGGGGGGGGGAGRTRAPAGSGGGAAGGGGKQGAAVDSNAPLNPAQYNFKTLRAQFNDQHQIGKDSAYDQVSPYFNDIKPAGADNTPQTGLQFNDKGGIDYYKDGKLQTSMMGNDANYWLQRINTARSNAGLEPIQTSLQGKGTMDDPYLLKTPWDYGSVPFNQYFTTTDTNKVGQKLRPEDAAKVASAQDISLGGRAGGGEDYLSSWAGAMGGPTTGPDLPAPTPVAPETGGQGYSASFGAQGAAPDAGLAFGPAPNDQAYTSRFNPPVQPPTPDEQAQTARFNPLFLPPAPSPPMVPITAQSVGIPPSAGSSGAVSYLDSTQPQPQPQPAFDPNLLMGGT